MGILVSHKNQVTYLEYAKVIKADERVGYIQENSGTQYTFALPYGNMAVLLLGPGTSITQAAMHHLCAEGCLIGFTGGGGFPIFCGGLSEYRPTEYAQSWLTLFARKAPSFPRRGGPRGPRAGMDSAVSPEPLPIIPAEAILTVCPSSALPSPASSASGSRISTLAPCASTPTG